MAQDPSLGLLGNMGWGRRSGKRPVEIPEGAPDTGDVVGSAAIPDFPVLMWNKEFC